MTKDGENPRRITNQQIPENPYINTYISEFVLAWSPDGQSILYATSKIDYESGEDLSNLCIANVDTGESNCFPNDTGEIIWNADWCSFSTPP